jgi:hypothetical protein
VGDDQREQGPGAGGGAAVPGDRGGQGGQGAGDDEGGGEHRHDVALGGRPGRQAAGRRLLGVDGDLLCAVHG